MKSNEIEIIKKCSYYIDSRKYHKVINILSDEIGRSPSNPDFFELLAKAYEKIGDETKAYENYKMAFLLLEGMGSYIKKVKLRHRLLFLKPLINKELINDDELEYSSSYIVWSVFKEFLAIVVLIPLILTIAARKPVFGLEINSNFFACLFFIFILVLVDAFEKYPFGKLFSPNGRFIFQHIKIVLFAIFFLGGLVILSHSNPYQIDNIGGYKIVFYFVPVFIIEGLIQLIVGWTAMKNRNPFVETPAEVADRKMNLEVFEKVAVKTVGYIANVHVVDSFPKNHSNKKYYRFSVRNITKPIQTDYEGDNIFDESYIANGSRVVLSSTPFIAESEFSTIYRKWHMFKSWSLGFLAILYLSFLGALSTAYPIKHYYPGMVKWGVFIIIIGGIIQVLITGVTALKDAPFLFRYNEMYEEAVYGIPELTETNAVIAILCYLKRFKRLLKVKQSFSIILVVIGMVGMIISYFFWSGSLKMNLPLIIIFFMVYFFITSVIAISDTHFRLKFADLLIDGWTNRQKWERGETSIN